MNTTSPPCSINSIKRGNQRRVHQEQNCRSGECMRRGGTTRGVSNHQNSDYQEINFTRGHNVDEPKQPLSKMLVSYQQAFHILPNDNIAATVLGVSNVSTSAHQDVTKVM
jgi:hypothetical protein